MGEPAASEVAAALRNPDDRSLISAVNVAEVIDVLVRIRGRTLEEVLEKLDWLVADGLEVREVNADVGTSAGRLHAEHYHRTERPLSLADCVALATARAAGEPLATSDPPLALVARREGCAVLALPDARGRRPPVE